MAFAIAYRILGSIARPRSLRFFAATEYGAPAGLETLLAHDVVLGATAAVRSPRLPGSLHERTRVACMFPAWVVTPPPGAGSPPIEVDGQPGGILLAGEHRPSYGRYALREDAGRRNAGGLCRVVVIVKAACADG